RRTDCNAITSGVRIACSENGKEPGATRESKSWGAGRDGVSRAKQFARRKMTPFPCADGYAHEFIPAQRCQCGFPGGFWPAALMNNATAQVLVLSRGPEPIQIFDAKSGF